jgi:hypothetical protein
VVFATVRWPTVERRQALVVRGNRRPPHAERTPQTLRANDRSTRQQTTRNAPRTYPQHTDIAAYRCQALTDNPYAGAAGQRARNGIWRRTAPPACYPIMGLVNQIRDTRIATVELFHAEPGSSRAPSPGRLAIGTSGTPAGEVQSQRSHEKVNDTFKFRVSYVGWRSARRRPFKRGAVLKYRPAPGTHPVMGPGSGSMADSRPHLHTKRL